MRTQARIHTLCWSDDAFLDLMWRSQHAYFLILSQPHVSFSGVCDLQIRRWARLCGDQRGNTMGRCVAELERKRFVVIDRSSNELWIRSFIKYDGIMSSPNLIVAMTRDFGQIVSPRIRAALLDQIGEGFPEQLPEGLWKRLAKPFREQFRERFPLAGARHAEPLPLSSFSLPPDEQTLPGSSDANNSPPAVVGRDDVKALARQLRVEP